MPCALHLPPPQSLANYSLKLSGDESSRRHCWWDKFLGKFVVRVRFPGTGSYQISRLHHTSQYKDQIWWAGKADLAG